MTTEQILWLLPLPPLLAFVIIILVTNRWKALKFLDCSRGGCHILDWEHGCFLHDRQLWRNLAKQYSNQIYPGFPLVTLS